MTEQDLLKKNKSKTEICQICGKEFYTNSKTKYCKNCLKKNRVKNNYKFNLIDKDFKELYEMFYKTIKKYARFFLYSNIQLYECVIEQSIVNLWLFFLRSLEKGKSINDLKNTKNTLIFFIVKQSYYAVIRANDIPPVLHCRNKKTPEEEVNALRLDMQKFSSLDEVDSLIDYIADSKPKIEHILDIKKLTNQIFMESAIDTDVKAAIIRAELSDINLKTSITEKEKIEMINEEYGLEIENTKQLKNKAQNGIYKLYNVYAAEIKDVLDITDKQFKINTNSKELKNHNFMLPIQRCVICGKAFIAKNNNNNLTCSNECAKTRANQLRSERRAKDRLKTLINTAYNAQTSNECFENLEKALKIM
ncbi:MAG: hypothetical protein LUH11_03235 [Candidatus Gastranaerophilales bacterium]|nr:hypothetical protein [Candidatus Gastranaerophilales bacterium]